MAIAAEALLKLRAVFDGDGFNKAARALGGIERSADQAKRSFKNVLDSSAWQGAAVAATGIGAGLVYSAKKAIELESQMVQVRKVVEFDSPNGLKKLQEDLIGLSTEIPYTAKELAELAAAAGMAGYAEKDILKFVEASAKMGTAFNMSASEAGDAMVAFQASMGLSLDQAINLGDAINHLSDNLAGVVEPAALVEVTKRIGAIGVASGLSAKDVAALGAAFLAPGTQADVAATGMKNFLKALTIGEAGSKGFKAAMDDLLGGITPKNMKGKSAQWISNMMQKDAKRAITLVIGELAKVPKEMQAGLISKIFGEESKAAIMPLLTNTKLLSQAFGLVAKEGDFAGSMTKEFNNQLNSSEVQLKLFKNNIDAIALSLGNALLPGINAILGVLKPFLGVLGFLAQKVPGFSAAIVGLGAAFAGLVISAPFISSLMTVATALRGLGILATVSGWLGAVVPLLSQVMPLISALGPVILTVGRVLVGIFTGPLGWATLLVTAAVALYTFRDKVAAFFAWMGPAVTAAGVVIRQGWGMLTIWLGSSLTTAITTMQQGWGAFSQWMATTLTNVGAALTAGLTTIGASFSLYVIQPIQAALTPLLMWIGQTIQAWSAAWWAYVVSGFNLYVVAPIQGAWQMLVVGMQTIWNGLVAWFSQSVAYLQQVFSGIWNQVSVGFNSYVLIPLQTGWNGLVLFFQQALSSLRGWFNTAWNGLSQVFYLNVVQPIQQMWSGFVQWLAGTIGNVRAFLGPMWSGLAQGFSLQIIQPLGSAWNGLMTGIRMAWSGLVQALSNSARGIGGALSAAFNNVVQGVRSAFQSVISWVTDSVNYLRGLVNGIIGRYNGVAQKVGAPPVQKFAKGGYVKGPTLAVVGEGKDPGEYIIPSGKMAQVATNYLAGARGMGVFRGGGVPAFAKGGFVAANGIRSTIPAFAKGGFVKGSGFTSYDDVRYLEMLKKQSESLGSKFVIFDSDRRYKSKQYDSIRKNIIDTTKKGYERAYERLTGIKLIPATAKTSPARASARAISRAKQENISTRTIMQGPASFQGWNFGAPFAKGFGFATGGFVTRPTLGLIGEGRDSEYIIPSSKMAASSMAYLSGARGMGVVNPPRFANGGVVGPTQNRSASLNALMDRSGGLTTGSVVVEAPTINATIEVTTGEVVQLDGQQYVSMDDFQRGMRTVQEKTMALLSTAAGRRATGR